MYAVVEHGGHQYRIAAGDRILVSRLDAPVGSTVSLAPVVFLRDGDETKTDRGALAAVSVTATVIRHLRGRKLRIAKYKAKKRYRRTMGYRDDLSEVAVVNILSGAESRRPRVAKGGAEEKPEAKAEAKPKTATKSPTKSKAKEEGDGT